MNLTGTTTKCYLMPDYFAVSAGDAIELFGPGERNDRWHEAVAPPLSGNAPSLPPRLLLARA